MNIINIEIKARCVRPDRAREALRSKAARFIGVDHQIDTYFNAPNGRLKLRQGNIERSLIHYFRPNQEGPKCSEVVLHHPEAEETESLKSALTSAMGVKVVVDKKREIAYIGNVKFHIDEVEGLGGFVEIEACSDNPDDAPRLREQVDEYMALLNVDKADLIDRSYSDLILEKSAKP